MWGDPKRDVDLHGQFEGWSLHFFIVQRPPLQAVWGRDLSPASEAIRGSVAIRGSEAIRGYKAIRGSEAIRGSDL